MPESAELTATPDATGEVLECATPDPEPAGGSLVLADELLVEDVSIDGMCGVY